MTCFLNVLKINLFFLLVDEKSHYIFLPTFFNSENNSEVKQFLNFLQIK